MLPAQLCLVFWGLSAVLLHTPPPLLTSGCSLHSVVVPDWARAVLLCRSKNYLQAVGVMKEGHIFTIEPMINAGGWKDTMWPDGWTVVTQVRLIIKLSSYAYRVIHRLHRWVT